MEIELDQQKIVESNTPFREALSQFAKLNPNMQTLNGQQIVDFGDKLLTLFIGRLYLSQDERKEKGK